MQIHASPVTAAKLSEQDAALPTTRNTLEENVCNVCECVCACVSERESVVSENKNSPRKVSPNKSSTKSAESKKQKTLLDLLSSTTRHLVLSPQGACSLRSLRPFRLERNS